MKTTPLIRMLRSILCASLPLFAFLNPSAAATAEDGTASTAIESTNPEQPSLTTDDSEASEETPAASESSESPQSAPETPKDSDNSESQAPADATEAADSAPDEEPEEPAGTEQAPPQSPSTPDDADAQQDDPTPMPADEASEPSSEPTSTEEPQDNSDPDAAGETAPAETEPNPPTATEPQPDGADSSDHSPQANTEAPVEDTGTDTPTADSGVSQPETAPAETEPNPLPHTEVPQDPPQAEPQAAAPAEARQGFSPWYLEEYPAYWPKQVALRVGMNFPGFSLPALSLVDVKDVKGLQVFFERNGKLYALYFDDTDIIARAWEVYRNPSKQNTVVDAGRIHTDTLLWPENVRLINPVVFGQGETAFTLPTGTELPFGRIKDEQLISEHNGETIAFNLSACDILEKAASNMVLNTDKDRYLTTRSMLDTAAWYLFRKGEFIPYDRSVGTRTDLYILFFIDEKTSIPFAASLASQIDAHIEKLRRMDLKVEVLQVSLNPDQQKHLKALVALKPEWPVMIHESGLANRLFRQITFQRNLPGVVWLKSDGSIQDQVFGIRTPDDLRYVISQNATGVQN
ncbi:MAG: brain acid soluble protein 1 [Opitutales bacterium]|nr:brain acid soluble protein 1 [Opitutales bacterium]